MSDLLADAAPWRTIADGLVPGLLEAAATIDPRQPRELARLRTAFDATLVNVALEIVDARRRAVRRLEGADSLIADVAGVEQATRTVVAAHKAARFLEREASRVVDLCCGIGSDARALARVAEVRAFDILPARAFMAERYAGCRAEVADVADVEWGGFRDELVHVDPARRSEQTGKGSSRRLHELDAMLPGIDVIGRVIGAARGGALKLSPAVDWRESPLRATTELEFVSDGGALVTAVAWFGRGFCEPGAVRATRLPEGATIVATGPRFAPGGDEDGKPSRFLYVPDPALERARLLGAVDPALRELHPGLGLLTSDAAIESPWLDRFETVASMSWRIDKVRDWLRGNDGGQVEVKTRGGAVDALAAQRELNGDGATPYVVFGLRLGRRIVAIIARRAGTDSVAAPSRR